MEGREFKFRFWIREQYDFDKEDKPYKMIYPETYPGWMVIDCKLFELMEGEGGVISGFPMYAMQYTGRKDKNGKEIYEGDIIRNSYKDIYDSYSYIEVVEYKNGYHFKHSGAHTMNQEIEVIGNIYENPELIK